MLGYLQQLDSSRKERSLKIELTIKEMAELHNLAALLVRLPQFEKHRSLLDGAGRKLRGALERSGAKLSQQEGGWLAFPREFAKKTQVDLAQGEAATLERCADLAMQKFQENDVALGALLEIRQKLAEQLTRIGAVLSPEGRWLIPGADSPHTL